MTILAIKEKVSYGIKIKICWCVLFRPSKSVGEFITHKES